MTLTQRTHGVTAAGDSSRQAAADRLFAILHSSPEYGAAVRQLRSLDELCDGDWCPPSSNDACGFGVAQFLRQDAGGALLSNQLIPADVDDVESHVRRALELKHPAALRGDGLPQERAYERRRDAELESAVRRCVELGADMPAELRRRGAVLDAVSESLQPLSRRIRDELSPQHIQCTPFERVHVALFAAVREALDLPDHDLPVRLALGAVVAGDLPAVNAWDAAYVPRPLGLDYDSLPHAAWNEWLAGDIAARAQEPRGAAEAGALWERAQAELDKGLCDGPWTAADLDAMYGRDSWRSMRLFGVLQNGSLRACDDAAESLHNASSTQHDKLRCTTPDAPVRTADRFAARRGRGSRGWSLELSTDDLDSAYRRALVAAPAHAVSAFYHPPSGEVRFLTRPGSCFGLVSAVLYFNAIPAATTSAARRLLGLPTDHFYDDLWLLMLRGCGADGQAALDALHRRFGYPLSLRKRKPPALARKFCGVVNDFTRLAEHGEVQLYVDDERKQKLVGLCEAGLVRLPPHDAERLCGKLRFSLSWSVGRVGLAALQPIQRRAESSHGHSGAVTPAIERALCFLIDVVGALAPRTLSLDAPSRPPLLVWSDAMCAPDADGGFHIEGGFVVVALPEDGAPGRAATPLRVWYADEIVGDDVFQHFVPNRQQYIGQAEKLYACLPYRALPDVFRDRQVIHFIDNTWALAALVKGYASAIDSGLIVHAFHAQSAALRADVFIEYVRSKANIADLPSRGALRELRRVLRRLGMLSAAVRVAASFPPLSSWHAPAREWLRMSAPALSAETPRGAKSRKKAGSDRDATRRVRSRR